MIPYRIRVRSTDEGNIGMWIRQEPNMDLMVVCRSTAAGTVLRKLETNIPSDASSSWAYYICQGFLLIPPPPFGGLLPLKTLPKLAIACGLVSSAGGMIPSNSFLL